MAKNVTFSHPLTFGRPLKFRPVASRDHITASLFKKGRFFGFPFFPGSHFLSVFRTVSALFRRRRFFGPNSKPVMFWQTEGQFNRAFANQLSQENATILCFLCIILSFLCISSTSCLRVSQNATKTSSRHLGICQTRQRQCPSACICR